MVLTKISELGSSVCCGSKLEEEIIPALGNGTAVPGDQVYILTADGKVAGSDLGAAELWTGILMEHPTLGTETAITAGLPCSVVIPQSGHRYRIRCLDLNAATQIGSPLDISATAYKVDAAADVNNALYVVSKPNADGDTVVEVRKT
jgi:hypothetical protein